MDFTMLPIDMKYLCMQHECNQYASFEMVYVYCVPCNPCLSVCYPNLCSDWIHCCLCNFVWKCIFNWNCQYDLWCFSQNCTLIFSIYGVFLHLRLSVQLVSIVFMNLVSKSCSRLKEHFVIPLHVIYIIYCYTNDIAMVFYICINTSGLSNFLKNVSMIFVSDQTLVT